MKLDRSSFRGSQPLFCTLKRVIQVAFVLSLFLEASAQQCTLPSRIFLPTADEDKVEQVGRAIDVFENYMVVGLLENSSFQVYSGRAFVYKLDANQQWSKIAELTPSNPGKYRQFGGQVSISGSSIVIHGYEFNNEGIERSKLYVYEKPASGEWTSASENYSITKNFGPPLEQTRFGPFRLMGNELITVSLEHAKSYIEVYKKSGGIFTLNQTIAAPIPSDGYSIYEWNLAVGDDFIALASEQFLHADHSNGATFIYEKNVSYATTPVVLRAANQTASSWHGFGLSVTISNSTLFVKGLEYDGTDYHESVYIFEKPSGGWIDSNKPPTLVIPGGYVWYYAAFVAQGDYLFTTGPDYRSIRGFKKPAGGWSSSAVAFVLNDLPADQALVAYQIRATNDHLVIGCPSRFLWEGVPDEYIADYYSPTGEWEASGLTHQQVIRETSVNATDDFFGEAFSVYNDQLAITARGDDEKGFNTGVVYIFNAQDQSGGPLQRVMNPEDENYSGFGDCLALGDSVMFVGAPYKDSVMSDGTRAYYDMGKVYVYRQTSQGWVYSSQIIGPNVSSDVDFGRQVVWSKGYCAVTEFYSGSSESIGRVHLYKEDHATGKFNYLATVDPSEHLRSDFFGQSMVLTDSILVVGTGNFAPNSSYRMQVFVFLKKGEWKNATEDASLMSTDTGWSDHFGASVSMYGEYIVVGAPFYPGYDPRPIPRDYIISGAAYVYKRPSGGWKGSLTEIAKLMPSDPVEMGTFGSSVAIDHNDIFIGSPNNYRRYNVTDMFNNDDPKLKPGKVYHYKKPVGEWKSTQQEERQILSFEPDVLDGYGAVMYVSDRYLYVGAMLDDTPSGFRTGSVQTMMQLPVIDAPPILCMDSEPIQLYGFPKHGNWSGDGVHPTSGMFNAADAGAGIHTITYERSGCDVTTTIEILPDQLNILEQSDLVQTKCIDSTIPIVFETNEDASQYEWYYKLTAADEFLKIDSLTQRIDAAEPGFYQVSIDRRVCPTKTLLFEVADEPKTEIKIEPVPVVCKDSEIQLTSEPTSGTWTGPGISVTGNLNTSALADGQYTERFEVVTAIGCHWRDSTSVTIDRLAEPEIEFSSLMVCKDTPATITVTNRDARTAISWYASPGQKLSGQSGSTLTTNKPGGYFAKVEKHTCSLNTPTVTLIVRPDSLFVPNVFTPNADTFNDYFEVTSDGIDNFHLILFNRYGQTLYEAHEPSFRWPAENVSSGVYYWRVTYGTCADVPKEANGWVQILK